MRPIIYFAIYFLPIVFCTSYKLNGQETAANAEKAQNTSNNLSAEQIAQIKANRAKQIELRNAFRETLTGNQLDILTDPGLNRAEKLNSFRSSLSVNQHRMIKAYKKQIRMQKFTLRSSFSNQQRMQIRRMGIKNAQRNRVFYYRSRMKRQPRI